MSFSVKSVKKSEFFRLDENVNMTLWTKRSICDKMASIRDVCVSRTLCNLREASLARILSSKESFLLSLSRGDSVVDEFGIVVTSLLGSMIKRFLIKLGVCGGGCVGASNVWIRGVLEMSLTAI